MHLENEIENKSGESVSQLDIVLDILYSNNRFIRGARRQDQ